jgi:hypothetical protein
MLRELNVVEQRYRAVLEVLSGTPVVEVAERHGVAQQTVTAGLPGTGPRVWMAWPTGPTRPDSTHGGSLGTPCLIARVTRCRSPTRRRYPGSYTTPEACSRRGRGLFLPCSMVGHRSWGEPLMMDVRQGGSGPVTVRCTALPVSSSPPARRRAGPTPQAQSRSGAPLCRSAPPARHGAGPPPHRHGQMPRPAGQSGYQPGRSPGPR